MRNCTNVHKENHQEINWEALQSNCLTANLIPVNGVRMRIKLNSVPIRMLLTKHSISHIPWTIDFYLT